MPPRLVSPATAAHGEDWRVLRSSLWADEDHAAAIAAWLRERPEEAPVLLAYDGARAVGLVEAAVRHDHVNGCDGSPVLFVEGLYVAANARRRGIARALSTAIEAWGIARGLSELASDAPLDNAASHALHAALGFAETERVVFFRRTMGARP